MALTIVAFTNIIGFICNNLYINGGSCMKRVKFFLFLVMFIAFFSFAEKGSVYAKEKVSLEDVYKVYKNILLDSSYKTFGLKDLNNDGIPELLINNAYEIYTYKDNNYIWLWDSWVVCKMYHLPKTNQIYYHYQYKYEDNESESWSIYEIDMDKGELVTIKDYDNFNGKYYANSILSTKEEVEAAVKDIAPDKVLLTTPYANTPENREKYLSAVKLSKEKLTIYAGGVKSQLKVMETDGTVKWSSSDSSIAKVSKDGYVNGIKPGKCVIKAEIDGKTLECIVTVKEIGLNKTSLTLKVNETYQLKVNGVKDGIKWSSSNKSIVRVSSSGKIRALKTGTATIKATVNGITYNCKVNVK